MGDNVQGNPIWAAPHLSWAWPHARIVFWGLVQLCSGKVRKLSHHILSGVHPSGGLVGVFHLKVDNVPTLKSLTQQSTLPFHTPVVLQPNLSSVSRHHGCSVHYPLASMGWCPSLHQTHVNLPAISSKKFIKTHSPCLLYTTWNIHLSSVDASVDVHGRSLSFPFIHPRVLFLAWCWVITRPLSSWGVVSVTSPGSRLDWGGSGTSIPYLVTPAHMGTAASDAKRSSQLLCRMCECPFWSFTSYARMSVTIWHTTSWGPPICPWSSSSLERHPPWVEQDHQVSNLWHQFSGHCTTSVSELLPQTGLGPLEEWPLSGLGQWLHIHPHTRWRCLTWAPLQSLRWGNESWLGALASAETSNSVGCTPSLQIRWDYEHALFQSDEVASQLSCLLPASQSFTW